MQNMCNVHHYVLTFLVRFGLTLYRHIIGIPMGTIVLLLLQICFCFVMRETFCCFFVLLTITKLMLLKLLTLPQGIDTPNLILIILISNK